MRNPEHFKMLEEQMQQFLFEGAEVAIEGYIPPSKA
jgi:Fe-S cluster biosynthesis and repair protein YggX